ncbi:VWA domain-containing protein [Anaerolineales bacterium HSG6]|nr:VWA domain-containing protein [Anaerolineales bacterium HSG6]
MENFLDQAEFADNPEPRCPVVLLLDTSHSMHGDPINQLNEALQEFASAIKRDTLASLRVEVSIVTFGGSVRALDVRGSGHQIPFEAEQAFVTVDMFEPPNLVVSGNTPMGGAIRQALHLLRERKEIYKQNSLDYFRPWIFLITDGEPTDDWQAAAQELKEEEARKGAIFFGIGVEVANMEILSSFSEQRPPLKLRGLAFGELFEWLSKSLSSVAHSKPGEQTPLPAVGWAQVDTSH